MTQSRSLDVKGNFRSFPLAELLVEIAQAKFSGSLRISHKDQKTVVYFDKGRLVYGVSNLKSLRLFNVMLRLKKIEKAALLEHTNFANDHELSRSVQRNGVFSAEEVESFVTAQIEAVIVDALSWNEAEWHFDPLARLRNDIRYEVDTDRILLDYARCLSGNAVLERFRSVDEAFVIDRERSKTCDLLPHEAYLLTRFADAPLTIQQLRGLCSLPDNGLLQTLYCLWLGGILHRRGWNSAFSATKIGEILSARVVKVKMADDLGPVDDLDNSDAPSGDPASEQQTTIADLNISLEEYLQRVEGAKTHYDTLGLENDADISAIKQTYFGLAKLFHPDKFHRESPARQTRIQAAFTELAHAYETLREAEAREAYNFKMRKEMEARAKSNAVGVPQDQVTDVKSESALSSFQQALVHINNDEYEQAAVLLARAVHYSPENAQFHAYYGQALSAFEGQLHKAESEFQTAVRLDPKNAKIRMMLVDFFIEMEMTKRAVGELNRFLQAVPGNKDAQRRLEELTKTQKPETHQN